MATRTISNAGGNWNATGAWAEAAVPGAGDDVVATPTSGNLTISSNGVTCHSLDFTNYVGTFAVSGTRTLTIGGSATLTTAAVLKFSTGMTLGSLATLSIGFDNRSGGVTVTTNGKDMSVFAGWSTVVNNTGTITLADNFNAGNLVFTHLRGGLTVTSGTTFTCGTFSTSGTNAKTLTYSNATVVCGTTFTVGGTAANFTITGDANSLLSLTGAFLIVLTGAGRTFPGTNSGKGVRVTNSFATISNSAGSFGRLYISNSGVQTSLADNFTVTGTLEIVEISGFRSYVSSNTNGTVRTITVTGAFAVTGADFRDITIAGASAPLTGTSVGNWGNNSGITFTGAVTRYWVGEGGNMSDTAHWSASSGGSSGASVPLPQDTMVFDNNSITTSAQTFTQDVQRSGSISAGGYSGPNFTMALIAGPPNLYYGLWGDLTFAAPITVTGIVQENKYGSATITQNGATLPALTLNGTGAVLTAADSITLSGEFIINIGKFQPNGFNHTFSHLTINNTSGNEYMSSAHTLTLTGTGTILSTAAASGFPGHASMDVVCSGSGAVTFGTNQFCGLRTLSTNILGSFSFGNNSSIEVETLVVRTTGAIAIPMDFYTASFRFKFIIRDATSYSTRIAFVNQGGLGCSMARTIRGDQALEHVNISNFVTYTNTDGGGSWYVGLDGLADGTGDALGNSPRATRSCGFFAAA